MISQFQLRMCETSMVGKLRHGILSRCKTKAFINYLYSKVFFLILVRVCFIFRKYVTIIECLCKYSNHCLFFWIGNIFLILLSTYLENTGRNARNKISWGQKISKFYGFIFAIGTFREISRDKFSRIGTFKYFCGINNRNNDIFLMNWWRLFTVNLQTPKSLTL